MRERPRSAEQIAAELAARPFAALDAFDPPRRGGLYAIKLAAGAWAGTALAGDDRATPESIAYVGKAEDRRGGIAARWHGEHLASHSGRSSPRRSWLAVLAPAWQLPIYARPCRPGGKPNVNCYVADGDGERRLHTWIERHYRVAALPLGEPELAELKTIENRVIELLRPYANEGTPHPLWAAVFAPGRRGLDRGGSAARVGRRAARAVRTAALREPLRTVGRHSRAYPQPTSITSRLVLC